MVAHIPHRQVGSYPGTVTLLASVAGGTAVVADEALTAAAAESFEAARRGRVEVRILDRIDELRLAAALFSHVWDSASADEPKVPLDLLRALSHAGGYVSGAWAGGDLVGASLGFARLGEGRLSLHSHITGVVPGSSGAGVGFALKLHQRLWALERDIEEVVWTFDPLVRRNGYFNVAKLGARIVDYYEDFYGPMPDGLNRRGESDRCLVRWVLLDRRVCSAIRGAAPRPGPAKANGVVTLLDQKGTLSRFRGDRHSECLRVWVPDDIVAIRREDPEAATRWRMSVRETLGVAIRSGWSVGVVRSDGWYELDPPARAEED